MHFFLMQRNPVFVKSSGVDYTPSTAIKFFLESGNLGKKIVKASTTGLPLTPSVAPHYLPSSKKYTTNSLWKYLNPLKQ